MFSCCIIQSMKLYPNQGEKKKGKNRREGVEHCRNTSWLSKTSFTDRTQLNKTFKKSLTGPDNQTAWD